MTRTETSYANRIHWWLVCASVILILAGCATAPIKKDLVRADRVEVVGVMLPEKYVFTDAAEVREITELLVSMDDNWRNYWATLPAPGYTFIFFEKDQQLAFVNVGADWIFNDGLIRTCTEEEIEALTERLPKRDYE